MCVENYKNLCMCSESACLETTPEQIFVDEADTNPVLIIDKLQKKVLTPHFHSKESMTKLVFREDD